MSSIMVVDCSKITCDDEPKNALVIKVIENNTKKILDKCSFVKKNKFILIDCSFHTKYGKSILSTIDKKYKSHNYWAYVPIESEYFNENLVLLADEGFKYPYICDVSPLQEAIPQSVALTKNKDFEFESSQTKLQILYVLENYENDSCMMNVSLDSDTLTYLKSATSKGWSRNKNGKTTQKELSGNLSLSNIMLQDNKIIHVLHLNEDSINIGHEESVTVSPSKYNFHSHPEQAYKKHKVNKAWPSLTDYQGYLMLGNSTLFHLVTTIEGLYIICFGKYWGEKLSELNKKELKKLKKFIDKNYDISRKTKMTPEECVEHVNSLMYEENPVFILQYHIWKDAGKIFEIYYAKSEGNNCFSCSTTHELYNKHFNFQ